MKKKKHNGKSTLVSVPGPKPQLENGEIHLTDAERNAVAQLDNRVTQIKFAIADAVIALCNQANLIQLIGAFDTTQNQFKNQVGTMATAHGIDPNVNRVHLDCSNMTLKATKMTQ